MPNIISEIFSFNNALNIYTAYNIGGIPAASAISLSSTADGVMSSKFGITRHYAGLSAKWGFVVHKAIKYTIESDNLSAKQKIFMTLAFSSIATAMVFFDNDMFNKDVEFKKALKSILFIAKFFDEDDVIDGLKESINSGYKETIKYVAINFKALISNKFLVSTFFQQSISMLKHIAIEKFLYSEYLDQYSLYKAAKDNINTAFKIIIENSLKNLIHKAIIRIDLTLIQPFFEKFFENKIDKKIAEIFFTPNRSLEVIKHGDIIRYIAYDDIPSQFRQAKDGIESLSKQLLLPIVQQSPNNLEHKMLLESFDHKICITILAKEFMRVMTDQKFIALYNKFLSILPSKVSTEKDNYEDTILTKIGNISIQTSTNPKIYSYSTIQEISKIGAENFSLSYLLSYIETSSKTVRYYQDVLITDLHSLFFEFIMQLIDIQSTSSFNLEFSDLEQIRKIVNNFTRITGENDLNPYNLLFNAQEKIPIETLENILNELKHGITDIGPERVNNESFKLSIQNYYLKVEGRNLLEIPDLSFSPNFIYAIQGQSGIGKTTFLNDIVRCMNVNIFDSSGNILYPAQEGTRAKIIFCGSEPFTPPGTTLLQRLSYRLPENYLDSNKDYIVNKCINLFQEFGMSKTFTKDKILEKATELSTGQGKVTLLISAILYKEFLKEPVLLVLDETLANLDDDTRDKCCEIVKVLFEDSIIISVDHNARSNPAFYTYYLDMSKFTPINNHSDTLLDVIGDID